MAGRTLPSSPPPRGHRALTASSPKTGGSFVFFRLPHESSARPGRRLSFQLRHRTTKKDIYGGFIFSSRISLFLRRRFPRCLVADNCAHAGRRRLACRSRCLAILNSARVSVFRPSRRRPPRASFSSVLPPLFFHGLHRIPLSFSISLTLTFLLSSFPLSSFHLPVSHFSAHSAAFPVRLAARTSPPTISYFAVHRLQRLTPSAAPARAYSCGLRRERARSIRSTDELR